MIVVISRWRLKEGQIAQFTDAWAQTTKALIPRGAMGSALFSAEDGTHYAIAKWPDQATRRRVFDEWEGDELIAAMQAGVEKRYPEVLLQEVKNLWP